MPAVQTDVLKNQNQEICYHRQVPKTRTVCLESGLRCLKSKQMRTEIRASVLENPGLKIKASIPIIWLSIPDIKAALPKNQDHCVCYHIQMPETRTPGIRAKMLQIKVSEMKSSPVCLKLLV